MVYRFYLFMIVLSFTAKGKYKQRPAQAYMGINRGQEKKRERSLCLKQAPAGVSLRARVPIIYRNDESWNDTREVVFHQ